jgi:CRISPR-associated protein Cst1
VKQLIQTNENFKYYIQNESSDLEKKDARKVLFQSIQNIAGFLDYDVEVIVKSRDHEFYETMFIRKQSIDILKNLKVYDPFCFSLKITDNYYMNIQKEVMNCILNLVRTDALIELFLKQNSEYLVSKFIEINRLICGGGEEMKQSMKAAYACAKEVAKKLPENKRESYRQKLTSAIVFKDYDRCCQILLQLSNYSDVSFEFAYDLFENFEENKDVAYTFINALTKKKEND